MLNGAVKNYIKHPTSLTGEAIHIAMDYADAALKTLSKGKVLDTELRQKVQNIIDKKLSKPEHEPLRRLITLHYVLEKPMKRVHKLLKISLLSAYNWKSELLLLVADSLYLAPIMVEKNKREIIDIIAVDKVAVAEICKRNNLIPVRQAAK